MMYECCDRPLRWPAGNPDTRRERETERRNLYILTTTQPLLISGQYINTRIIHVRKMVRSRLCADRSGKDLFCQTCTTQTNDKPQVIHGYHVMINILNPVPTQYCFILGYMLQRRWLTSPSTSSFKVFKKTSCLVLKPWACPAENLSRITFTTL